MSERLFKFKYLGYDATILDGQMELSVADETDGAKVLVKLSKHLLDRKLKSLRLNLPDKIIYATAKDSNHMSIRAEEANNKKTLN